MPVGADSTRTLFRMTGDERLSAGVSGAAAHVADGMGFSADHCTALASVVGEASREAFSRLTDPQGMVGVTLEQFRDRIEVILEYEGQPLPAAGLDTTSVVGAAGTDSRGKSGTRLLQRVDRVQFETQGRTSRLRLIKYLPANSSDSL